MSSAATPGETTPEATCAPPSSAPTTPSLCEYVPLLGAECDRRLKEGPEMVSANFVIPYPPGFPIMVPGQVLTQETIDFMRKLDVKEIHGYEKARGLKLRETRRRRRQGEARRSRRQGETLSAAACARTRRGPPASRGSCPGAGPAFWFNTPLGRVSDRVRLAVGNSAGAAAFG